MVNLDKFRGSSMLYQNKDFLNLYLNAGTKDLLNEVCAGEYLLKNLKRYGFSLVSLKRDDGFKLVVKYNEDSPLFYSSLESRVLDLVSCYIKEGYCTDLEVCFEDEDKVVCSFNHRGTFLQRYVEISYYKLTLNTHEGKIEFIINIDFNTKTGDTFFNVI